MFQLSGFYCRRRAEGFRSPRALGRWTFGAYPKGPCTHILDTLALKYLYRDYFKAHVCITQSLQNPLAKEY